MLAGAPKSRNEPSIEAWVDESLPRLCVTVSGNVSGDKMAKALVDLYCARPEVIPMDMLFDIRDYEGAVEADHVVSIVQAYLQYDPDPLHPCRTAFVTVDKNFRLWAAAMSFQFRGREHRAFETMEEAERWLAEPMEQRPPFEAVE